MNASILELFVLPRDLFVVVVALLLLMMLFYSFCQRFWKSPKMTDYSSFVLNSLRQYRVVSIRCQIEQKKHTQCNHNAGVCVFFFLHRYYVLCIHYPFEFSENDFGIITSFALNEAIVLLDIDTRFTAAAHHYSNSVNNIRLLHVQPKWHSRGVTIYPYSIFYG